VTVRLEPGRYTAMWFGAQTGERIPLPAITGTPWNSPDAPDMNDWALLIQKE
jgi:hypothetical protein